MPAVTAADLIYQDAISTLNTLIGIPSLSGQETKAADYLQGLLESLFPGAVSRHQNNIVADIRGTNTGPTLLLCSHIDTVGPLDTWTVNPFVPTIEDDRLYGLGANDAGASLVSLIAAARLSIPLAKGRILLCLVAEEEEGTNGFMNIERLLPRYDGAIFGEPTDLKMVSAMRGAMKVTMKSRGVACHAGMPWNGENAIDRFSDDLRKLRAIDLKDDSCWNGATMEPTIIAGGKLPNQIPSLVETTINIRTTPKRNKDWFLKVLALNNLETDVDPDFVIRSPIMTPENSGIVKAFRRSNGNKTDCIFYGSCDMAFSKAPSIILGPGNLKMAHVDDEYASLHSIREAIGVYADIAKSFLSF